MKKLFILLLVATSSFGWTASNSKFIEPGFKVIKTIKNQGIDKFYVDWMVDVSARHVPEYSGYGNLYELAIPYYEKTNKKAPLFEPYPKEFKSFDDIIYNICNAAQMDYSMVRQLEGHLQFERLESKKDKSTNWACIDKHNNVKYVFVLDAKRYQKLNLRMYSEADFIAYRGELHKSLDRLTSKKKAILKKFQDTLKIDFRTNYGQVLEIKHPIALIRYKSRTVWFRIEQLGPLGLF